MEKRLTGKTVAYLGLLSAIIILLQVSTNLLFKIGIQIPFTLAFIPIILGSSMLGVGAGFFLGFVFSCVVFVCGLTGLDAFTFGLIQYKPFEIILVIFAKGMLSSGISSLVYKAISKKNVVVASFVSAPLYPIINTGVFALGMILFFKDYIIKNFGKGETNIIVIVFVTLITVNFFIELAVSIATAPVIKVVDKIRSKK